MSPGQSPLESSTTYPHTLPLLSLSLEKKPRISLTITSIVVLLSTARSHSHTLCVATLGSKHQTGATQQLRQNEGEREGQPQQELGRRHSGQWESPPRLVSKSKSKAMGIFECNWLIDFDSFACSFALLHTFSRLWEGERRGEGRTLLQPIISWKANVSRTFGDIIVPCDFYLPRANFVTREKTQTQQSYSSSFIPAPSPLHTH